MLHDDETIHRSVKVVAWILFNSLFAKPFNNRRVFLFDYYCMAWKSQMRNIYYNKITNDCMCMRRCLMCCMMQRWVFIWILFEWNFYKAQCFCVGLFFFEIMMWNLHIWKEEYIRSGIVWIYVVACIVVWWLSVIVVRIYSYSIENWYINPLA